MEKFTSEFLLGLKAVNDAEIKVWSTKEIGKQVQQGVADAAKRGERIAQIDVKFYNEKEDDSVTIENKTQELESFLDKNIGDVLVALRTDYFDRSVIVEVKRMILKPSTGWSWIETDNLDSGDLLRIGNVGIKPKYIFEITW